MKMKMKEFAELILQNDKNALISINIDKKTTCNIDEVVLKLNTWYNPSILNKNQRRGGINVYSLMMDDSYMKLLILLEVDGVAIGLCRKIDRISFRYIYVDSNEFNNIIFYGDIIGESFFVDYSSKMAKKVLRSYGVNILWDSYPEE